MKIAIVGSRNFSDYDKLVSFINESIYVEKITKVISGGARGADTLAEQFAKEYDIETLIFLPDWKTYGKKAGFLRNKDIIKNSDMVFAFWDTVSLGTLSSINLAKKQKKKLFILEY